jgi:predicted dehydrogenase
MIKVAVIGVGYLGQHHARIYSSLSECRLTGVSDINSERGKTIAANYRTNHYQNYQELLNVVDAVSIAVPTVEHFSIASAFLEAGCHVLVEKPMTSTLEEADELIRLAEKNKKVLFVGHTERFNPSIQMAREKIKDPGFIEAHRLGTFAKRSTDVDVILDLMIHDLDIIGHMVSDDVESIDSIGVRALTDKVDIANARITFKKGCVANITASRISAEKVRKIRIFQPESYLSIDCAEQEVQYYYLVREEGKSPRIQKEHLAVERDEPLKREILSFLSSLQENGVPEVSGEDGRKALKIAFEIRNQMIRS